MQAIQTIYDDNHQIYGAPKIAKEMQKKGEKISERTVGVYMREIGIKACYIKQRLLAEQAKRGMVYRYNVYIYLGRICIPYKCNGSIFKKNNCMDIIKNIGSGRSIEMYRDG